MYDLFVKKERPRVTSYLPFLVPVILYFTLRSYAVEKGNLFSSLNITESAWVAPFLVMKYLINMIFPFHLSVLYDIHVNLVHTVSSLIGIAILVYTGYHFRKQGEVVLSISWFFLFLLPVVNIIQLNAASLISDRYAYFSLMGFALALAFIVC